MVERAVVLGAGRLGVPMAQVLAMAGYMVELVDLRERTDRDWAELVIRARRAWAAGARLLGDSRGDFWRRLRLRRGYGRWLRTAACLFEALPEDLALKRAVYQQLGRWLRPECLVGATSASLAPADLAPLLPHPDRFLLTHWSQPVLVMPLVEMAPGEATSAEVVEQMDGLLRRCGKEPVLLSGRPGLVSARLTSLVESETARMVDEALGSPEAIDRAVRLGLGLRLLAGGLAWRRDEEATMREALRLRGILDLGGE
ncbi:MAG: 3-hydroxyacyl-CoA dehydrogenase NAD-binding domain-containing protein [Bacillota bacterium]